MADLSFPLDKPLSPLEMKRRLLRLNGKLHAVRKWKDPQADKAIHLLVKDNIGVTGFPTSAGSHALKDLELPDAFCIQRLRRNPKIEIFGKTHLTELAGFVTSNVLPYGRRFRSKSPWKLSLRGFKRRICHCRRSRFLRCSPWH